MELSDKIIEAENDLETLQENLKRMRNDLRNKNQHFDDIRIITSERFEKLFAKHNDTEWNRDQIWEFENKIIFFQWSDPYYEYEYEYISNLMESKGYSTSDWEMISPNFHPSMEKYPNWKGFSNYLYTTAFNQCSDLGRSPQYIPFSDKVTNILSTHHRNFDFFSFNNQYRESREKFIKDVLERNLWDKSLISAHFSIDGVDEVPSFVDYRKKDIEYKSVQNNYSKDNTIFDFPHTRESVENLPISILRDTFFTVIMETYPKSIHGGPPTVCLTEKAYNYFSLCPAVLIGNKGILKQMRKEGLKTFPDMFDESYDEISDYNERFNAAMNEVEKFCKLDYDVKMEKYLKSFDNILHNQKIYLEIYEGINIFPHIKGKGHPIMKDWFNYYMNRVK